MPIQQDQLPERGSKAVASVKGRIETKLGDIWWAIMLRGLLAIALGLCAFLWPQRTIGILVKLLGAYFMTDGVIGAVGAYRSSEKAAPLMQTVVSLALGFALLVWTGVTAKIFLVLVGIWLILQGVGLYLSSRNVEPNESERGLMQGIGIVTALIGLVFVFWTDTGEVAIAWLVGIAAVVLGGLLVYLSSRIKRLQASVRMVEVDAAHFLRGVISSFSSVVIIATFSLSRRQ